MALLVAKRSKSKVRCQFMDFNIWVLKVCLLWTDDENYSYNRVRYLKDMAVIISLMPCTLAIIGDFVLQLWDGLQNLTFVVENMIALNCIIGMIYMVICFINNRRTIIKLVASLNRFKIYGNWSKVEEVDNRINLFSKVFMFYGILGNFVYMLMPQLSVDKCNKIRSLNMIDDGMPCGLVVRSRLPFRFDKSPVFELVFINQIYTCTIVSVVVLALTMLFCGFLMHLVNQLNTLKIYINDLKMCSTPEKVLDKIIFVIRYHIDIIKYSEDTAKAFSTMLLFYITLTSLVLSVLCFEIIMVDAFEDSVRFSLHLVGWLVILLSICYSGQLLIDESISIADDIYSIHWFNFDVNLQEKVQMIIMRSQKPMVMNAAGMGIVSLPAFLKVLSSAYSFFTLLLKFKS